MPTKHIICVYNDSCQIDILYSLQKDGQVLDFSNERKKGQKLLKFWLEILIDFYAKQKIDVSF